MRSAILLLLSSTVAVFGGQLTPAERGIAQARAAIAKEPAKAEHQNALALALARRARETAATNYYDQAALALRKSLELEPGNFGARKAKAWILLGKHEFAAALDLAKELNREVPDDVTVYGLLTDANIELGKYKDAEVSAQWMLDLGRNSIPALTRAAYLRELFGDLEGSLELMNSAWQRLPPTATEDRAWVLTQIGHLLNSMGKPEEAAGALERALQLFPDYHYALGGLAQVRAAQGRRLEAVQLLRTRCRLAPHPENYYDLGVALDAAGLKRESRDVLADFEKRALAEMQSWDNANRELIAYYADRANRPADALRVAELEIARRRDIFTLDAYAWALYRNGRPGPARRPIERALAVGTRDSKLLYHAGVIALDAKDPGAAKRWLQQAIEANPRFEYAVAARGLLAEAAGGGQP